MLKTHARAQLLRARMHAATHSQALLPALNAADQHADLAEWVDYHLGLGASHVYVYDTGSQLPVESVLAPYIEVDAGPLHASCCDACARVNVLH
jgi:hypothetical protein